MKIPLKAGAVTLLAVFSLMLTAPPPAPGQTEGAGPTVIPEIQHVTSPPLRELVQAAPRAVAPRVIPLRRVPSRQPEAVAPQTPDPAVQESAGPLVSTTNLLNFDGIAADGFIPPDTNGSIGATQFVETVNIEFAIYNKSNGALLLGPTNISTLFSAMPGLCTTGDISDPIVLYDKAAGRWLLSVLAFNNTFSSNLECVAVSTSSDATGSYNLYSFSFGSNLNDYPKFGVWPDAYYFSAVMFAKGTTFMGPQACAFPRSAMLAGNSASMICFQRGTSDGVLMPSDLDGSTQPPAGEPNFFMELASNSLNLFKFHVDFTTPSNSTFTGPTNIPVAAYTQACGGGTCIPQLGTSQQLDSLGDRLMFRLAYRNFGDHESLVVNHSVQVDPVTGQVGVRWYEVRDPNGIPTIFQQSTFAPDANFRWMGSIAMDHAGDMAVGYSESRSSLNPQIQYTGRVPSDPPSTLEAEATIIDGTGSQLPITCGGGPCGQRWGDYTSMSIDPIDDCTFWYSNEYLITSGDFNWQTRIGSFKFPNCVGPPAPGLHFVAATPCRIADTRNANGPFGGPFLSGGATARAFTIPLSACNIPATAQAYSVNVTVVPHGLLGYLTLFPCGQPQPFVSTLNSIDGRVKAVAAIVPAGTNGDVCFFVTDDTDLVLDIDGYFVPAATPSSLAFYPVTPCRLVDTRLAAGPLGGPALVGGAARTFPLLSSRCNVPLTAQAYSLNYTSVPQGSLGFLTTWPAGQTQPFVSTLNAPTGVTTANAAIVSAGTAGAVTVFVTNNSDLVIDINGYFAPPAAGGLSLFNLAPCRVLDTRNPPGSQPFNGTINVNVEATVCGAPATAQSYVLNATVVPPGSLGYLTLWPQGAVQPFVSTLNAVDGFVTSNMAIVLTTNGSVSAFATNSTHLVLDISGYFAP